MFQCLLSLSIISVYVAQQVPRNIHTQTFNTAFYKNHITQTFNTAFYKNNIIQTWAWGILIFEFESRKFGTHPTWDYVVFHLHLVIQLKGYHLHPFFKNNLQNEVHDAYKNDSFKKRCTQTSFVNFLLKIKWIENWIFALDFALKRSSWKLLWKKLNFVYIFPV